MPLDSNLNKDLHEDVSWHCLVTNRLDSNDPKKFSKTTPKKARNAYLRLWDPTLIPHGSPCSKRIVEDIYRIVDEVLMKIFYSRGTVVKGLGTRRGRRNDLGLGKLPRGGRKVKHTNFEKKWVHIDAIDSYRSKIKTKQS